jgi:hypothetical protein
MNKLLLPPHVDDKRKVPELMPHFKALVKGVTELRKGGLRACYCTEEITLQRIHPLGHREKLTFECPRLVDPTRDPLVGKTLNFFAEITLIL